MNDDFFRQPEDADELLAFMEERERHGGMQYVWAVEHTERDSWLAIADPDHWRWTSEWHAATIFFRQEDAEMMCSVVQHGRVSRYRIKRA